jgi:hypothetical protein
VSLFRRRGRSASSARLPRRTDRGLLRRERRALLDARATRVLDLGGLAAEMYRYGAWRDDLIQERCAEIAGIDARLDDIDALLGIAPRTPHCSCGALLRTGVEFCSSCGRKVEAAAGAAPSDTIVERPSPQGD